MARPQRNNVDYFPFYCDEGNKMFYIEETYGNDGFAVFIKLLRELAKTNYHYLDLSKKTTKMFLSAKCKVPTKTLEAIINDLVELGKFDSELWNKNSIVWCQDFIDSIQDAYIKRSNTCIDKKSLLGILSSKGLRKHPKVTPKQGKSGSEGVVNPQRIVKNTKEEERKEDEKEKHSPEFLEKSKSIAEPICKYFSIGETNQFQNYKVIFLFSEWLLNNVRDHEFKIQFQAYRDYKEKSGETIHGWKKFIGIYPDYNGIWNDLDWPDKLKRYDGSQKVYTKMDFTENIAL